NPAVRWKRHWRPKRGGRDMKTRARSYVGWTLCTRPMPGITEKSSAPHPNRPRIRPRNLCLLPRACILDPIAQHLERCLPCDLRQRIHRPLAGSSLAVRRRNRGKDEIHVERAEIGEHRRTHLLSLPKSIRDLIRASGRISESELRDHTSRLVHL